MLPGLFFGTTIATCIIAQKKSKLSNATLFLGALRKFMRSENKNRLMSERQQKILDAFTEEEDTEHIARLVNNNETAENGYDISVSSYAEREDTREAVDIGVLNAEIARIVSRQSQLRTEIDAIVADLARRSGMSEAPGEEVVLYQREGAPAIDVRLSLNQLADLLGRDKSTIPRHIFNVFAEGEPERSSVAAKFATTAADGKTCQVERYNLDAIISVGYRVKSGQGKRFRVWATERLREYL